MNIKVTNMDTGTVVVMDETTFDETKAMLSENAVYEQTEEQTTLKASYQEDVRKLADFVSGLGVRS